MNQFIADVGALNGWQGMVDEVSGQVSSFKGSFAGPSDLASSHGAIGFPMQNAFDGASSARAGALGATQVAAGRMAQLLGEASQAYQRGDVAAGDRLRAQAEAIEGAGSPASARGAADPASSASGGAGQMVGQFSQLAGQMAQSITQPLQGLTEAMTQVPQQVMQGVQGIVESATQAAGGGGDAAALAADHQGRDDAPGEGPADRDGGQGDGQGKDKDKDDRASAGAAATDSYDIGMAPTQIHHINPRRQ